MKKIIIIVALLISTLCISSIALAGQSWYVDNLVASSGNGQSWSTAWKTFSNINYGSVSCGDTIYISGGHSGTTQTYTTLLAIDKTCTNKDSPLTITVGTDPDHNGTVKITGVPIGISISEKNYIKIDGQSGEDEKRHIEIAGTTSYGIYVSGASSYNIFKYLYLHDIGSDDNDYYTALRIRTTGMENLIGYDISYCSFEGTMDAISISAVDDVKASSFGGVKIHHNYIKAHDDGILSDGTTEIYDNIISRDTDVGKGHPDGIQVYGSYVKIYNNLFTGFLDQNSGNSVVYWEPDGSENININNHQPCCFQVYNNVFYETGSQIAPLTAVMLGVSDSRFTSLNDLQILNNTFNGNFAIALTLAFGNTSLDKSVVTNVNILNNIFYNAAKSGASMLTLNRPSYTTTPVDYGSYNSGANIIVDYNAYYSDSTTSVGYLGTTYTYSNFLSVSSCQENGVTKSINLNSDLTLQYDSPCKNAIPTANAPRIFTTDKLGITRPQGSAWDIGAYEFRSNTPMIGVYNVKGMSGYYNANGMVGIAPN